MKTDLQTLIREGKITQKTLDRVNIAKSYIEKKYSMKKTQEEEKKKEWETINQKLAELNIPNEQKEELKEQFLHQEANYMRQGRKKITIYEFEPLGIIGRGAFGEVRVCRHKPTGDIVAVKKMKKEDMLNKNQLMHIRTEREILTSNSPWIVNLKYSFQDDYFLYLVMDYSPGGDLMNLLMRKDILTEDEARFYTAEMILAVDSVHKLNCIHRDLKPDNILIGKKGHIQLSDFGLSKIGDATIYPMSSKDDSKANVTASNDDQITIHSAKLTGRESLIATKKKVKKKSRLMAFSTVGTPDYIAPEVFGKNGYGQEVDWWSIGVMFFEMVVGYPPFFSENPSETCKKIVKWNRYFGIPEDANLTPAAKSLITRFVSDKETRLGINGIEEIKKHPFFKGVDWDNIRNTTAPFIPRLENDWDTKYFDKFEEQEPFYPQIKKSKKRKDVNYAGYTFNRDVENMSSGFVNALELLDVVKKSLEEKKEQEKKDNPGGNSNNAHEVSNESEPKAPIVEQEKPPAKQILPKKEEKAVKIKGPQPQPAQLVNKIIISNDLTHNHKKVSKSPELKNKEKLNSAVASIPLKSQREGFINRISPGKQTKEKVSLINKIKLNIETGAAVKKNVYSNTHTNAVSSTLGLKNKFDLKNKKK